MTILSLQSHSVKMNSLTIFPKIINLLLGEIQITFRFLFLTKDMMKVEVAQENLVLIGHYQENLTGTFLMK